MADVKWIKIATNIFENRKIKQMEALPDGDGLIVIWFKLLCLAGTVNDSGEVYLTKEIPYTDQMLASYFNRPLPVVQMALGLFQKFGMIDVIDDIIFVSSWEKHQNIDGLEKIREQNKKRVASHRKKQQLLRKKSACNGDVTQCNVTCNGDVTQCNATDIDRDIDIDNSNIDIENNTFVEFSKNSTEEGDKKIATKGKSAIILELDHVINVLCKEYASGRNNKTESRKPIIDLLKGKKKFSGLRKPVRLDHIRLHYAVKQYMFDCKRDELETKKILLLSTFLNGRVMDYVEKTQQTYEAYMMNTYGEEWQSVIFEYR